MTLLFITRKIDPLDERAGFVIEWLQELALQTEKLIVICQEIGEWLNKPNNVVVYSLGKERGKSKLYQFIKCQLLMIKCLPKVNGILAHMMPIYGILAGPWCKIFSKKLIQWYAHGAVDWRLKLANFFVDEFVTSSKDGFRLITKKPVHIVGQAININKFKHESVKSENEKFIILSVGRISPVKNLDILISSIENLNLNEPALHDKILVQIIGGPGLITQASYLKELEQTATDKKLNSIIDFIGPVPPIEILPYYQNADLFINLSDTGSLDKAVLEAMAAGLLILTSNPAYQDIIPQELFLPEKTFELVAEKIKYLYFLDQQRKTDLKTKLMQEVANNHNLTNWAKRIIALYD